MGGAPRRGSQDPRRPSSSSTVPTHPSFFRWVVAKAWALRDIAIRGDSDSTHLGHVLALLDCRSLGSGPRRSGPQSPGLQVVWGPRATLTHLKAPALKQKEEVPTVTHSFDLAGRDQGVCEQTARSFAVF